MDSQCIFKYKSHFHTILVKLNQIETSSLHSIHIHFGLQYFNTFSLNCEKKHKHHVKILVS